MTLDEAIAHAQNETARADRERAMRIAAETARLVTDGDLFASNARHRSDVAALAIGWFFDGVREVMLCDLDHVIAKKAIRASDRGRAAAAVCELLVAWGRFRDCVRLANELFEANKRIVEGRDYRFPPQSWGYTYSSPPLWCSECTRKRLHIDDLYARMGELANEVLRAESDRDRYIARNRELEQRLAEVRRICR